MTCESPFLFKPSIPRARHFHPNKLKIRVFFKALQALSTFHFFDANDIIKRVVSITFSLATEIAHE